MGERPVIAFLSDYGLRDEFVGVCHGVIARLCPDARVIDLHHAIPRQDVATGARVLARALPFLPAGVALAVVDPEVGARRRALALRCADGRALVGPDNGLLLAAGARFGGVEQAVEITASPWRLEPVSATFHGRDLFAPVAARLAGGALLAEAGSPIEPTELVPAPAAPAVRVEDGALVLSATQVDGFGNVELAATHADLMALGIGIGDAVRLLVHGGTEHAGRVARTFAEVEPGDLLLYEDAGGTLAFAVNTGSAQDRLGVEPGDELRLERA